MKKSALAFAVLTAFSANAYIDFDAGANLRIREEMMNNVVGCPNGSFVRRAAGHFTNHIRFRPRVWGELRFGNDEIGKWRLYTRLADEIRWNIEPKKSDYSWPDEVVLDNLFLEGKELFDGFLDVGIGRRDLYGYGDGLTRLFVDGTPGDGSRSLYADMATVTMHVSETDKLDLFFMHNSDDNENLRWGDYNSKHRSLTMRNIGDEDRDEWAGGAIWGGRWNALAYQFFVMEKAVEHEDHLELAGVNLKHPITDEVSAELELMNQFDKDCSVFAAINWKSKEEGVRPFAGISFWYLGPEWDPMWARAPIDSEMFLYGTHNGLGWWSNQYLVKFSAGLEFSRQHSFTAYTEPIFAAENDGVGGGNGQFKGLNTCFLYKFPIILADKTKGERFEIVGHILAEFFNPGDYYESDRPAYFLRWQVEFKF